MNDLDDLLRQDARSWRTPPVAPPDVRAALDHHRTRRNRLLAAGALVAVVALAAGAGVLLNRPGSSMPAVPDPMATLAPSPSPTPSEPSGATKPAAISQVAAAVRAKAADQGIVVSAEAVATTWLEVQEFLPTDGPEPSGDTEVWLAQVDGEFNCDNCQADDTGPEAASRYLIVVLDARSLEVYHLEGSDTGRSLANLGRPTTLDVD